MLCIKRLSKYFHMGSEIQIKTTNTCDLQEQDSVLTSVCLIIQCDFS